MYTSIEREGEREMAVKSGHGNGSRGRSYGVLLMLAFGADIFGIMILHKLRERRIFNLLLQEKDHQLLSLQLLLQKEKDNVRDGKRQMEEMKAKVHKLRTKKLDLESRVVEMQSTISSLREEQRTISSALEEKQKMLMDYKKHGENQESARLMALSEVLRKKEAEVEELKKRRTELPVKVWSVSADDPSNRQLNLTTRAARDSDAADASSDENGKSRRGKTSGQTENKMQDGEDQHHNKLEDSQVSSNTNNLQGEKSNSETNATNSNEVGTNTGNNHSRSSVNSDYGKLGKQIHSESTGRRRTRGKRRKMSIKNTGGSDISQKSETEGVESMRSGKSYTETGEASELKTPEGKEGSNESPHKDPNAQLPNKANGETVKPNTIDATTAGNEKSADGRDNSDKVDNAENVQQMEGGQEIKVKDTEHDDSPSNLQNMPANSTIMEDMEFLNKTESHTSEENGLPEVGTNTIRENKDGEDNEASRITEKDVKEDDLDEAGDDQETEKGAETSRNLTANAEEDDEPEF